MNGNIFARLSGTKRNLLALLASSAMLTAGCANMASMSSGSSGASPLTVSATLSGKVHGGNQPVSGATVNLYFAAQSIYTAPTLAATTTSAADGTGSFSFVLNTTSPNDGSDNTFSCPTNEGSPLVYVVAKGGNTLNNGDSSVNNSAAAFIGIYGNCSLLSTPKFLDLSEVTTVATMAAVQQFFDPSNDGISADGTGQQFTIVSNIINTIGQLANVTTGTAVTSTTIPANGGTGVGGVSITATPETSKLNSLANALAACVNNASSTATACTTLFASAVPPSPSLTNKPGGTVFAPATDVVQAAYYILTNPTNGNSTNLGNIFTLAGGLGAPYQPSLALAPTDWTIAVSYASTNTCGSSGGSFIGSAYDINVDASDNIWIANSQATKGNLSEISAAGAPATCVFFGGTSNGSTIDSSGNVWLATTESNNIYRYTPSSGASLAFATPSTPLGVTADGLGNVYFSSSSNGSLYQIPGAAAAHSAVSAVQISDIVGPNPIRLMPDFNGLVATVPNPVDIWVTSGNGYVSRVSPGTGGPNVLNGFSTTTYSTGGANAYGLAVTHSNDVIVSSGATDNFVVYLSAANSYAASWTTSAGFAGLNNPTALAIDGQNNIWVPNNTNPSLLAGSVSEISAAGNALSPTATGFQKATSFLSSGRTSVIDQAGNVWVVGDGTTNSVTEIIGAAVPVFQPYALGLANGRFQTIP